MAGSDLMSSIWKPIVIHYIIFTRCMLKLVVHGLHGLLRRGLNTLKFLMNEAGMEEGEQRPLI